MLQNTCCPMWDWDGKYKAETATIIIFKRQHNKCVFAVNNIKLEWIALPFHWTNCSFSTYEWRKYNATNMPFAERCTVYGSFASFVNRFRFRPEQWSFTQHRIWKFTSVIVETRIDTDAISLLILILSRWSRKEIKYIILYSIATRVKYFQSNFELKKKRECRLVRLNVVVYSCKISALSWLSWSNQKKIKLRYSVVLRGEQLKFQECKKDFWTKLLFSNNWISGQFLKQLPVHAVRMLFEDEKKTTTKLSLVLIKI